MGNAAGVGDDPDESSLAFDAAIVWWVVVFVDGMAGAASK